MSLPRISKGIAGGRERSINNEASLRVRITATDPREFQFRMLVEDPRAESAHKLNQYLLALEDGCVVVVEVAVVAVVVGTGVELPAPIMHCE